MAKTATGVQRDTRALLLEAGMNVMFEKGYTNTGIQEVLSSVGVPKGSFYHFFESKEDFALKIIRHVEEAYVQVLNGFLHDTTRTPVERLKNYCETKKKDLLNQSCRRGCLIGNLSQEMADQSEVLRVDLARVMGRWRDMFSAVIDEGQARGEISKKLPADKLAEMFLCGWEGSIMRAKTQKNVEPMQAFIDVVFTQVLAP
jgi:TetR/AcrR family transcriptional repressor of nem operon